MDRIPSSNLAETLSPSSWSPSWNDLLNEECFSSRLITLAPSPSSKLCLLPAMVNILSSTSMLTWFFVNPGISAMIPILSSYAYTLTFGYALPSKHLIPNSSVKFGNWFSITLSNKRSNGVRNSSRLKNWGRFAVWSASLVIIVSYCIYCFSQIILPSFELQYLYSLINIKKLL